MRAIMSWLPFLTSIIALVFAALVFRRYVARRGNHLLIWGFGLLMYGIASFCEAHFTVFGWNPAVFRLWYFFGAILSAAWLGQGTIHLLVRTGWANALVLVLLVGSLFALARVLGAELDPNLITGDELSGHAITTGGVRILTPFFNTYGTVALVGGAAYSAWTFWRNRIRRHRAIGNVLIAVGAMAPALGGLLSRMGLGGYLYLGELVGAVLMFVGFIRATAPMEKAG